ncbi:MAG: PH domain-containing protein [Oscillospiraceae bacterium]|nr:PH domain-containing protein [Oscillospiraceae bacterium]
MEFLKHRLHHARRSRNKARCGIRHQHPIAVLRYTNKYFWILLIPVVRTLIAYSFNLVHLMRVMWWDILIIAFFFLLAWLRWYFTEYMLGDDSILCVNGFIAKQASEIPYSKISAVTAEKYMWMYPLKCSYILIDTDAKSTEMKKTSPDIKLIMRDDDIDRVFSIVKRQDMDENVYTSRISKGSLVSFSLLFSSALSGVTLLGALLINAGDIVGDTLQNTFFSAVNTAAETVNKKALYIIAKIPTVTITIAIIIFIGWLISFLGNLLRHMHFTFEKRGGSITISDGFLTQRKYHIQRDHINYADLRQNLLMKLFRVMSVNVNCSGYGKGKNEIPVFIPISKSAKVRSILKRIFPDMEWEADTIPIKFRYIWRYVGPPAVILNLITVAAGVLICLFREWFDVIFFTMIMAQVPILWLLIVKTAAFCTSGVSYNREVVCLKYCRGYEFHTILVPEDRISKIVISRNIFQQFNGSCDFIVYTNSEYTKSHRVRGVDYRSALWLFNKYSESESTP